MRVLIVDGANVVGSRPDGWWRDRPAAARRLYEQLAAAELPYGEVVLVLEGAARKGVEESSGGVHVVHAAGEGDDSIVDLVSRQVSAETEVTVVTADRHLRGRVSAVDAEVLGPGWLLDRL